MRKFLPKIKKTRYTPSEPVPLNIVPTSGDEVMEHLQNFTLTKSSFSTFGGNNSTIGANHSSFGGNNSSFGGNFGGNLVGSMKKKRNSWSRGGERLKKNFFKKIFGCSARCDINTIKINPKIIFCLNILQFSTWNFSWTIFFIFN